MSKQPHDPILTPTSAEAPLVALVTMDLSTMNEADKRTTLDRIRALRAVAGTRKQAVSKSARAAKASADGYSIEDLI